MKFGILFGLILVFIGISYVPFTGFLYTMLPIAVAFIVGVYGGKWFL